MNADAETQDATSSPLSDAVAEVAPLLLASLNDDFADSTLLVARTLGGRPGAGRAQATGLDAAGVDLDVDADDGPVAARVDFAEPVTSADDLTSALLELVGRAREAGGEEGQTEGERVAAEAARIRTFVTEVVAVRDVGPHLREVTLGGGDLADFTPCGPDTFLYLLVPPPGRGELTIGRDFTWEQHATMDDADKPVGAYYTLRRWRPEAGELDLHLVLHGDEGAASAWALGAAPGDPVALWGPRTAYHPPEGTDHLVLVADETGLPAAAVILEQLPSGCTAHLVAEVAGPEDHQEVPAGPGIEVTWLHRVDVAPGRPSGLVDAVRALPPFPGTPYVWGGGESRAITAVRRHVRDERDLAREAVSLVAYWRAPGPAAD